MKRAVFDELRRARAGNRPIALITFLDSGEQVLYLPEHSDWPDGLDPRARPRVDQAIRDDRSETMEMAAGPVFVHVFNPPLRLLVVGAVHIAQVLVPVARMCDYAVTVIDPRRAFATDARFPDVVVSREWPDKALERFVPDNRTAVVTLSHDPKLDDRALRVALRSAAFYVGCLGSRRTHSLRSERLRGEGFSEEKIARIHAPIGLAIGAKSPAEIAVAIMAEITRSLHGGASH